MQKPGAAPGSTIPLTPGITNCPGMGGNCPLVVDALFNAMAWEDASSDDFAATVLVAVVPESWQPTYVNGGPLPDSVRAATIVSANRTQCYGSGWP
jgi:hypothetical protein